MAVNPEVDGEWEEIDSQFRDHRSTLMAHLEEQYGAEVDDWIQKGSLNHLVVRFYPHQVKVDIDLPRRLEISTSHHDPSYSWELSLSEEAVDSIHDEFLARMGEALQETLESLMASFAPSNVKEITSQFFEGMKDGSAFANKRDGVDAGFMMDCELPELPGQLLFFRHHLDMLSEWWEYPNLWALVADQLPEECRLALEDQRAKDQV